MGAAHPSRGERVTLTNQLILINEPSTRISGTHLQGYIRASGAELIRKLGQPQEGDGYKVFSEWTIESDNGVATIYDWKGANILDESVSTWNIGGHDRSCWQVLDDAGIEENLTCTTEDVDWYLYGRGIEENQA